MKSISTLFGVVLGGLMLTMTFAPPASADTTASPAPATCGAAGEIGKVVNGVCVLSKTARGGDIAVAPPSVPQYAKPRIVVPTPHHYVARNHITTKLKLPFTGPPPVGSIALIGSSMIVAGCLLLRAGRKHV